MANKPSISSVSVKKSGHTQSKVDVRMQEKKQRKEVDKKVAQELDKIKAEYKEQIRKQKQQIDKLKKKVSAQTTTVGDEVGAGENGSNGVSHGLAPMLVLNILFAIIALFWLGGVFKDFIPTHLTLDITGYLLLACTVINMTLLWVRIKSTQ